MKQLKCEMCNSTDFIKQDGVFVCQECGCKYSVEEAKKLLGDAEENDCQPTTTNNIKLDNLLELALNEINVKNFSKAETICDQIIALDSTKYEPWLYKGKCELWQSSLINLRIQQAISNFEKAIEKTPKDKFDELKQTIVNELALFANVFMQQCCDTYIITTPFSEASKVSECYDVINKAIFPYIEKCGGMIQNSKHALAITIASAVVKAYEKIEPYRNSAFSDKYSPRAYDALDLDEFALSLLAQNEKTIRILIYKNIIAIKSDIESKNGSYTINGVRLKDKCCKEVKLRIIDEIMQLHQKIKELNPEYVIPERPQPTGGCYVATCVYGSYDCPQVWTLRRFRDNTLAETMLGRTFIRTYYAISPTLVKWFGNTAWFKRMWKGILDRMVSKLQDNGIESTPYEDKNW